MRILALFLVLAVAFCDKTDFYHVEGSMDVNNENGKVFGVVINEFLKSINMTYMAGMYVKNNVHTPFEFGTKIVDMKKLPDDRIAYNISCVEGKLGKHNIKKISGNATMIIYLKNMILNGKFESPADHLKFEFKVAGILYPCAYYTMPEAAKRAGYLVGEKYTAYKPVHVLNHAVFGYAYMRYTCLDYLKNVGNPIEKEKPGAVIIAKDGSYCAIVDHEGDKFIHSNPSKRKVIMTPMNMIGYYFRKGYVMKEYSCAN